METFVPSRGGLVWTIVEGAGVPLLLCNGGPGCCDYLEPVAHLLTDVARVIRFEQSGCGRSEENPPYDIAACVSDMESIRVHYGIHQWIVAGHSWGADLALMYALQFPERVMGFICIAGGRFHNDREWHRLYSQRQEQGLEPLPHFQYPPNMEVNRQGNASWRGYIQRPHLWKDISLLDRPGLFLYGANDIRPSWPVEQVACLLPNAKFHLIEGADHHLWTSHSGVMQERLGGFIHHIATGE
jgi:proline iminopeptidase